MIRRFADIADEETKEEMEILLAGGTITKRVFIMVCKEQSGSRAWITRYCIAFCKKRCVVVKG